MPVSIKLVSWNIKDFGTYDYSSTMDFMADILKEADVVMILEVACDRVSKGIRIGSRATRTCAFDAVEEMRQLLEKNDGGTEWSAFVSGVNAGSLRRDAYAVLWKDTPSLSKFPSSITAPSKIELLGEVDILDSAIHVFPDRRPGIANFRLTDSTGGTRTIPVIAFHASVPTDSMDAKKSIYAMANTVEDLKLPNVIIGGDFNVDFDTQTPFYKQFVTDFGLTCCIGNPDVPGSGKKTSLVSKWASGTVEYTSSAYDNFFFKGAGLRFLGASSIDFILTYANEYYYTLTAASGLFQAWKKLYPRHQAKAQFGQHKYLPEAVSDHLPVYLNIEIT